MPASPVPQPASRYRTGPMLTNDGGPRLSTDAQGVSTQDLADAIGSPLSAFGTERFRNSEIDCLARYVALEFIYDPLPYISHREEVLEGTTGRFLRH